MYVVEAGRGFNLCKTNDRVVCLLLCFILKQDHKVFSKYLLRFNYGILVWMSMHIVQD